MQKPFKDIFESFIDEKKIISKKPNIINKSYNEIFNGKPSLIPEIKQLQQNKKNLDIINLPLFFKTNDAISRYYDKTSHIKKPNYQAFA